MLKTADTAADPPHSTPEPTVPVEVFALAEPVASSASVATANPETPAADSIEESAQPSPDPGSPDPGSLAFQLSLNSPQSESRAQAKPAEQTEVPEFLSEEEIFSAPEKNTGASDSDTKNQNQQEQPPAAAQLPTATDGTVASQFGFQTPFSFATQIPLAKTEITPTAASTRTPENVSTPDLPTAPSVDRVGLTIRGAGDQVVRVQINQSGELVQVGVHTGNSSLANELRISVPELVGRLGQQGYESKVTMPSTSFVNSSPAVIAAAQSGFRSGADTSGNAKSNGNFASHEEPRQQRQRNPQRSWQELASQLQED
jgi:hypothetical protein